MSVDGADFDIGHGDVVIAAITSCTNTSNPCVMIAAGLLARKAVAKGLKAKPWVKTSLAPGSQVVSDYLAKSGLQADLDELGFNLVGFGCTTCIGNSGPLPEPISEAIDKGDLVAAAVLSGNRNFEGRINPDVRANYLASPPLVVAYALAGSLQIDLVNEPLGTDKDGNPVYLKDIWPTTQEIAEFIRREHHARAVPRRNTPTSSRATRTGRAIEVEGGLTYDWNAGLDLRPEPALFRGHAAASPSRSPTSSARACSASSAIRSPPTTSRRPARSSATSPAGDYLLEHQVRPADFNQYGTRRGNHEVMMRGTFANIRIKNQMVAGRRRRRHHALARRRRSCRSTTRPCATRAEGVPLVVFAGKEYGTGSSRDWAAKGTRLLGVRAVIAESFERIHRSNLVGMGVLPLVFEEGTSWQTLGLKGDETVTIRGLATD